MTAVLLLLGVMLLYLGAEILVRHASEFAAILGISKLIVGLTIVAYGTSTPELMVNIVASINNSTDIAVGNIVGSNIFNILFVLGASAIICPLAVHRQIIRLDVPIMIGVSALLWLIAFSRVLYFWTGILLLTGIIAYTLFVIDYSKKHSHVDVAQKKQKQIDKKRLCTHLAWITLSLGVLTVGSECLVNGAIRLARIWGVSELIISLTIIAAGTGLPELATSILAAIRGHKEIAVGNRYALAIYEIAKELNRVEDMYKELKIVMETYELNIDFKKYYQLSLQSIQKDTYEIRKQFFDLFKAKANACNISLKLDDLEKLDNLEENFKDLLEKILIEVYPLVKVSGIDEFAMCDDGKIMRANVEEMKKKIILQEDKLKMGCNEKFKKQIDTLNKQLKEKKDEIAQLREKLNEMIVSQEQKYEKKRDAIYKKINIKRVVNENQVKNGRSFLGRCSSDYHDNKKLLAYILLPPYVEPRIDIEEERSFHSIFWIPRSIELQEKEGWFFFRSGSGRE